MSAPLSVWLRCGMILRYMDAVPPVHLVEIVPPSASGAGQPWAPWKGALEFFSVLGEYNLIYLREMLMLAHL